MLEAKVLRDRKRAYKKSEDELAVQFEAIQSRRSDVTRLEGLRDTALAQRDHVLGLKNVRADLIRRVAARTARCRQGTGGARRDQPAPGHRRPRLPAPAH